MAEQLHYYVYLLIDPRNEKPFYVGKGSGDRCFAHVEEAHKTEKDTSKDYPKLRTIREIERSGQVRIELLRWGLEGDEGEQTAYAIEAAAIDLLRLDLDNRASGLARGKGRISAEEVTSPLEPPRPTSTLAQTHAGANARQFRVGMDEEALYVATRQWWRIGADRMKLGTPRSPEWAMAVYKGVVRAVYKIERWRPPSARQVAANPRLKGRWAFTGKLASEMTARYAGSEVSAKLPVSAQNPIRYVNCD